MKYYLLVIILLCSLILSAQEKTFTLSELDSITAIDEIVKDSNFFKFPIFEGCEKEKNNLKKKECLNQKISRFFEQNYNTTLPDDSKVPTGKIRIFVEFKVDERGNIVDGKATGPDEYFENEALRVLKLLPKLTPGYYKGKPVEIPFSIPLSAFVINKKPETVNATYPVYRGCKKNASFMETKKCTTEKIIDYIKVSFDYELADKVFPTDLTTKFYVEFTINKKGRAEKINVKANHKAIAIDVINLIKRMPKFKVPGTNDGKPVSVGFNALMTVRLLG